MIEHDAFAHHLDQPCPTWNRETGLGCAQCARRTSRVWVCSCCVALLVLLAFLAKQWTCATGQVARAAGVCKLSINVLIRIERRTAQGRDGAVARW